MKPKIPDSGILWEYESFHFGVHIAPLTNLSAESWSILVKDFVEENKSSKEITSLDGRVKAILFKNVVECVWSKSDTYTSEDMETIFALQEHIQLGE